MLRASVLVAESQHACRSRAAGEVFLEKEIFLRYKESAAAAYRLGC